MHHYRPDDEAWLDLLEHYQPWAGCVFLASMGDPVFGHGHGHQNDVCHSCMGGVCTVHPWIHNHCLRRLLMGFYLKYDRCPNHPIGIVCWSILQHSPVTPAPKEVRWDSQTLQLKAGWAKYWWGPLTPLGLWSCIFLFPYQDGVPEKSSVAIGAVRWFSLSTSHLLAVWRLSGVCFKEKEEYPIKLLRMSFIQFPFELKPLSAGPRWRSVCGI